MKCFELLSVSYPNAALARIVLTGNVLQSIMNLSASAIRLYYVKESKVSVLVSEEYLAGYGPKGACTFTYIKAFICYQCVINL